MMVESMEVTPSEDQGNISPEEIAPVTPKDTPPPGDSPVIPNPAPAAEDEKELFELPDGRKVDASTLTKEWKDNFLPDYTRKSQDLARIKGAVEPEIKNDKPKNPLDDPNWQPQTYAEIVKAAQEATIKEIEGRETAREQARTDLEAAVATQLAEVKKLDANVDENALFLHATKYKFRDLRDAFGNMKDMQATVKKVQNKTVQDIAKRNDPVSIVPGGTGGKPNPSSFGSAVEYLRAIRGQ